MYNPASICVDYSAVSVIITYLGSLFFSAHRPAFLIFSKDEVGYDGRTLPCDLDSFIDVLSYDGRNLPMLLFFLKLKWAMMSPLSRKTEKEQGNEVLRFPAPYLFYFKYFFSSSTLSSTSHGRFRSSLPKWP